MKLLDTRVAITCFASGLVGAILTYALVLASVPNLEVGILPDATMVGTTGGVIGVLAGVVAILFHALMKAKDEQIALLERENADLKAARDRLLELLLEVKRR